MLSSMNYSSAGPSSSGYYLTGPSSSGYNSASSFTPYTLLLLSLSAIAAFLVLA